MNDKKIVLCDVDGVLTDIITHAIQLYKDLTKLDILGSQITSMPVLKAVSKLHPVIELQEKLNDQLHEILAEEGVCLSMLLFPGAQEAIEKIMSDPKLDLYILTAPLSRSKTWTYERTQWLKKHFNISHKKIIFADDKHLIHGHIFIDDAPDNIRNWVDYNKEFGMVFAGPQNSSYNMSDLNVVYSWDEVLWNIDQIKEFGYIEEAYKK